LHLASPFVLKEPKDKMEMINPAVNGTLFVLRAASRLAVKPLRVVLTSSIASIAYGSDPTTTIYGDDTWTDPNNPKFPIKTYYESKVLAERAAWDFVNSLPPENKIELATVLPALVLGPMIANNECESVTVIKNMLMGKFFSLLLSQRLNSVMLFILNRKNCRFAKYSNGNLLCIRRC
jgi:dihydroflavonol-4-reductase